MLAFLCSDFRAESSFIWDEKLWMLLSFGLHVVVYPKETRMRTFLANCDGTNIIWKGVFSRCWVVKRLRFWTCRRNCWIAILVFLTDTIKIVLYRHRWLAERQWQRHGSCARCYDVMLLLFNFKMKQLVPVVFRSIIVWLVFCRNVITSRCSNHLYPYPDTS